MGTGLFLWMISLIPVVVDPQRKSGHVKEGHMDVGPSLFRSPLLVASDMSWMPATTTERGWREPAGA